MGLVVFLKVFGIGKESSFTDDIFIKVQMMIEGLKSKVRHSHMVGIGIDETNGNFPAPWFPDSSFLFFKNLFGLLNKFPGYHFLVIRVWCW